MHKILIIDTDGGVDDALCIALASYLAPHDEIIITTSFGNVCVGQVNKNIHLILSLLSRKMKHFSGANCALDGASPNASYVHGSDGLGGYSKDITHNLHCDPEGIEDLVSYLGSLSNNVVIEILGIGPATNISYLLDMIPHNVISKITLMSGVIFDRGNITVYSEFNAYCDPVALRNIISEEIPTYIVPLDLCRKVLFGRDKLKSLKQFGELADLLMFSHDFYMKQYKIWEQIDGCFPHDAITLMVCLSPEKFIDYGMDISIDLSEEKRGFITPTLNEKSNIRVVLGGDLAWLRQEFNFENIIAS